jgi:ABC-type dipeptide/oligopeptide/nickel transport system permease component
VTELRAQLGLDDPQPVQFGRFLFNAVRGDLGTSIRSHRPVALEVADNFPQTLQLAFAGLLLAGLIGVPLGVIAAVRPGSWLDLGATLLALLGVSVPSFWLGLLLVLLLSLRLPVLPATGGGDLLHLFLPALTLGLGGAAILARLTRASMRDVLHQEYLRTARAKGLRERVVVLGHGLRNALIPILTIFGLQFGHLLAGAVVVETVFARPGLGRLAVDAILNKDIPLVQGIVLVIATSYLLVNLAVDLLYAAADPRIRLA